MAWQGGIQTLRNRNVACWWPEESVAKLDRQICQKPFTNTYKEDSRAATPGEESTGPDEESAGSSFAFCLFPSGPEMVDQTTLKSVPLPFLYIQLIQQFEVTF